jgi:hypothetical protein
VAANRHRFVGRVLQVGHRVSSRLAALSSSTSLAGSPALTLNFKIFWAQWSG